ncbi:hypothetical protein GOV12_01325 [Candidatus Pacearchaeota archaeon]|nr:hypothetical protein [Candidatus Pacearchaeota archaeon]
MTNRTSNIKRDTYVKGINASFKKDYGGEVLNTIEGCLDAMEFMLERIEGANGNDDYEAIDCRVGELLILARDSGEDTEKFENEIDRIGRLYCDKAGIPGIRVRVDHAKCCKKLDEKSPREYGDDAEDPDDRAISLDIGTLDIMGEFIR